MFSSIRPLTKGSWNCEKINILHLMGLKIVILQVKEGNWLLSPQFLVVVFNLKTSRNITTYSFPHYFSAYLPLPFRILLFNSCSLLQALLKGGNHFSHTIHIVINFRHFDNITSLPFISISATPSWENKIPLTFGRIFL